MVEIEAPSPAPRMFRRILVALDASPHSRAALRTVVQWAAVLDAEVEGLFVKDANLLRAAQLPFAEEVRTHSVAPRRLSDRRAERQLRRRAERAEALLQKLTEAAEVASDFRVAEGPVPGELLRAAEEADLLAMGKTSTRSSRRRLGTTSQALLTDASIPVLVLRRAVPSRQSVLTYHDGSESTQSALHTAARLAASGAGRPLRVFIPASGEAHPQRLHDAISAEYGSRVPRLYVHPLTEIERDQIAALARREGEGLVVMPDGTGPLSETPFERFLYELDRPLLVVR